MHAVGLTDILYFIKRLAKGIVKSWHASERRGPNQLKERRGERKAKLIIPATP